MESVSKLKSNKKQTSPPGIAIKYVMNKWSSWHVNTLKGCSADGCALQTRRWSMSMLTNVIQMTGAKQRNGSLDTSSTGRILLSLSAKRARP